MSPGGDVDELEYLCVSKGNFEILLRELLLVKHFRVEVYTTNKVKYIEIQLFPKCYKQYKHFVYHRINLFSR